MAIVNRFCTSAFLLAVMLQSAQAANELGTFTDQCDLGAPSSTGAGSAEFDGAKKTIAIAGGGANIWANSDAFHFVWTKVSGDVSLAANIAFAEATPGADPHRKAVVMIRQSLEPDSIYADASVHGNGLSAIQWRDTKGDVTYETQTNANAPKRIRIEKRGSYVSMSYGDAEEKMQPAGGTCKIELPSEFYIGIGVCAHNNARIEKAVFSEIVLSQLPAATGQLADGNMISTLQTIQLSSKDRRAVLVITQPRLQRAEAPNWSADNSLYFNNRGKLFKMKASLPAGTPPSAEAISATPEAIEFGPLANLNNDHAISPDGKMLALSGRMPGIAQSAIFLAPIAGGAAKRITENVPSYLHGWSPDGKTLVFCGERASNFDIYAIPADGGAEQRLTTSAGKDDGPEFTPDGKTVYFNSDRSGTMQIWRMQPDGTQQQQVTNDESNNWFPHLSPNGRQLVFLTYDRSVTDHPENKDVTLRLMDIATGKISVLAKLFGGQGTMNVPSWSPDGRFLAFMSYQIVPK